MKKTVLLLVALFASLTAWAANVVETVTSYENVTKNSTVYVGEVVVDGTSVIKYLYSDDVTMYSVVRQNLLDALTGMADDDYAALFQANWPDNYTPEAFAFCADAELAAAMDENWSNAQYVGSLYYPGKTVTSTVNSNLYDLDEGFKAVLDAKTEERVSTIDNPLNEEKCIVFHLGANATENVYYTVEDGQVIKHVDTHIDYSCEVTTVIYTKVELTSSAYSITLPESFEHGSVTCDKESAAEGETVTLTVTPDENYELESLTVTTVDGTDPSGAPMLAPRRANVDCTAGENGTYTFLMPAAPVTVNATFKESTVTGLIDLDAAQPNSGQRYNLMGQPVGKDYKGIVIEDGKKMIVR